MLTSSRCGSCPSLSLEVATVLTFRMATSLPLLSPVLEMEPIGTQGLEHAKQLLYH
jgi:hypothetical protein